MTGAQEAIGAIIDSHIRFSYENDNMDYLFSPAPQEVWAEYFALIREERITFHFKHLKVQVEDEDISPNIPPFIIQEVTSDEHASW